MKERRKTQLFQDISNTKCYEGAITENTLLHERKSSMITKKGLSILLAGTMVLSLAACGGSTETAKAANSGGTEATQENAAEKNLLL